MRTTRIAVRSASRQVQEWLDRGPLSARVLAAFEQVCNLVTSDGDVIALVAPQVDNGPFNVVLEDMAGLWGQVRPGAEVICERDRLLLSDGQGGISFQVDLEGAVVYLDSVPLGEPLDRDDFILFSESNSRFLVEVAPGARAEFEELMGATRLAVIGRVTAAEMLEVYGVNGERVVSRAISDLKEAWQRPLRW